MWMAMGSPEDHKERQEKQQEMVQPLIHRNEAAMTGEGSGPTLEFVDGIELFPPSRWKVTGTLRLAFDRDNTEGGTNRLILVDTTVVPNGSDPKIIDAMYAYDVIGVHVDIATHGPDADLGLQAFRNTGSNPDIFKAIYDDKDSVFVSEKDDIPVNATATATLKVFCYPKGPEGGLCGSSPPDTMGPNPNYDPKKSTGPRAAHHRSFVVKALPDFKPLIELVQSIRNLAGLTNQKDKKHLVIVNPKAGLGKAPKVLIDYIVPMLEEEAGMNLQVIETKHANHAAELIKSNQINPADFDAVIGLGGDGIMSEVFQGINARDDRDAILKNLTIGMVGCGTGNGLACSVAAESNEKMRILESVFLIAKGDTKHMDVSKYSARSESYLSFLTFSWGLIADVDIESDAIRFMGSIRYELWAAMRIFTKRQYRARFSYLPPGLVNDIHSYDMPTLDQPVPDNWTTIEDDFILFWASHVSHASRTTHNSPNSTLDDGVFRIFILRYVLTCS